MKILFILIFVLIQYSFAQEQTIRKGFVWHSSIFSSEPKKIELDTRGIQIGQDNISRGRIQIIHKGTACNFDKLTKVEFSKWRKDCQLAVQFLFSTEAYLKAVLSSNLLMPKNIIIHIEDENASCSATATIPSDGSGEIEFCPIEKDNLDLYLKYGSEVLFHELTHLLIENKTTENYVLSSAYEDIPTLFSYFISGRSKFLTTDDAIYDPQVSFGKNSTGNYGSLIALTSTIIDLQKLIFDQLKSTKDKEVFFRKYIEAVINVFFEVTVNTSERDFINLLFGRVPSILNAWPQIDQEKLLKVFSQSVIKRKLDLSQEAYDGLTQAILVNHIPTSVPARIAYQRTIENERLNPKISLYDPKLANKETLTGFIMPIDFFTELQECLDSSNIPNFKDRSYFCYTELTKKSLTIGNREIKSRIFELTKHLDEFQLFQDIGTRANIGATILYVYIFDKAKNQVQLFSILV